jgi:hypothetical protein
MEDAQEPSLGPKISGLGRHLGQGRGTGMKQETVEHPLVLPDQWDQLMRQAEDQMEVADR